MPDAPNPSRLEEICRLFARFGVEFVVIGGQAEYLFGSPRVTYDIDLCYRRTSENLDRLAEALKAIHPTLRGVPEDLPFTADARSLAIGANFTFNTPFGPLDLLGWVEPIGDYDALIKHAESYRIGDIDFRTISLSDLIRIREHLRRPKDRDSLFQLQAIQQLRKQSHDGS